MLELVQPYIEGFSVKSIKEEDPDEPMPLATKRKTDDVNVKSKKKAK